MNNQAFRHGDRARLNEKGDNRPDRFRPAGSNQLNHRSDRSPPPSGTKSNPRAPPPPPNVRGRISSCQAPDRCYKERSVMLVERQAMQDTVCSHRQ
jgi:hypothetical protein